LARDREEQTLTATEMLRRLGSGEKSANGTRIQNTKNQGSDFARRTVCSSSDKKLTAKNWFGARTRRIPSREQLTSGVLLVASWRTRKNRQQQNETARPDLKSGDSTRSNTTDTHSMQNLNFLLKSTKIHTTTVVTVLPPSFDWKLKFSSWLTSTLVNMK
jgi:hypothetical protein